MDQLDKGKDKLKKICEVLRSEALEPAKNDAEKIIDEAKAEAKRIIDEAKKENTRLLTEAAIDIEKKKKLFESSLASAAKQAMLALRQEIEKNLFNEELVEWTEKATTSPEAAAKLVDAIVMAVAKDGIDADLTAAIAATLTPESVNALLAKELLAKLREKSVVLGAFKGGIEVKLHEKKLTLDLSGSALAELLAKYLGKDFHKHLFALTS